MSSKKDFNKSGNVWWSNKSFLPSVIVDLVGTYVETHSLPFVCELHNTIWMGEWLINELRSLSNVIVFRSANSNTRLQKEFLRCLQNDNPSQKVQIYNATCYPNTSLKLKHAQQLYLPQHHTCRSCVKVGKCAVQCLCRYHYYCSLKCKESHYRRAVELSGKWRSIFSSHTRVCWESRIKPKILYSDSLTLSYFRIDLAPPQYIQEIIDEHREIVEWVIKGTIRRKRVHILAKVFPFLKMVVYTRGGYWDDRDKTCADHAFTTCESISIPQDVSQILLY